MGGPKLDFQVIATTLMGAMNESVSGFLKVKQDKEPTIVTKPLYVEDKWNVSSYGEFIDGSYISVIYFYRHAKDRGTNNYCGMLVLIITNSIVNYMVKGFGYKNSQEAGAEMAADIAAELANNIAGVFKKDLSGVGYPELEISAPMKFKGFAVGLDYPKGEKQFHRVTSFVWGQRIVADVILGL